MARSIQILSYNIMDSLRLLLRTAPLPPASGLGHRGRHHGHCHRVRPESGDLHLIIQFIINYNDDNLRWGQNRSLCHSHSEIETNFNYTKRDLIKILKEIEEGVIDSEIRKKKLKS